MTTEEFVKGFHLHKQEMLQVYLSHGSDTHVGQLIEKLNLSEEQRATFEKLLDASFNDLMYSILLAFDGSTSIGNLEQQLYTIFDEKGNQLGGEEQCGDIEALAYEYFHEGNS